MPIPSNYPPGVTGNEPQIAGEDVQFGLECLDCNELFLDIEEAAQHPCEQNLSSPTYVIVSEAL